MPGGHVVLRSTHYIAASGHFGRKSHHFFDVAMRLAYHFSANKFSTLPWKWYCSWGRQPAGAEVGLKFGCGSPEAAVGIGVGVALDVFRALVEPCL